MTLASRAPWQQVAGDKGRLPLWMETSHHLPALLIYMAVGPCKHLTQTPMPPMYNESHREL